MVGCMFLPCCQICQTANKAGESGCLYVLLSFITPCVPILLLRSKVRDQYNIPGSTLGDVCAACLCPCCASIQLANEVEERIWAGMGWLKFRARNTKNRIFSIPGRLPLIKMLKGPSKRDIYLGRKNLHPLKLYSWNYSFFCFSKAM